MMSAQPTSSEATPKSRPRISLLEVALLLLITGCGLSLLLPGLDASREAARANLCARNLRRLDKAALMHLDFRRTLPSGSTWPVELISILQDMAGERRQLLGEKLFTSPRPVELTCPAHMYFPSGNEQTMTSHYVMIVDRNADSTVDSPRTWWFRDSAVNSEETLESQWYSGIELTPTAAEAQLHSAKGPHRDATFMESTTGSQTRPVRPQSSSF